MTMWNVLLLLKTYNKLDIEWMCLNTIKISCGKPTTSTSTEHVMMSTLATSVQYRIEVHRQEDSNKMN